MWPRVLVDSEVSDLPKLTIVVRKKIMSNTSIPKRSSGIAWKKLKKIISNKIYHHRYHTGLLFAVLITQTRDSLRERLDRWRLHWLRESQHLPNLVLERSATNHIQQVYHTCHILQNYFRFLDFLLLQIFFQRLLTLIWSVRIILQSFSREHHES